LVLDLTLDLFAWWEISISWSIVFLIVAGFYLYSSSRLERKGDRREESKEEMNDVHSIERPAEKIRFGARARSMVKDFSFVWVLIGLLVFYIFSVKLGTGALSEMVFALGNIAVEALLVFYLLRNRDKAHADSKKKSKTT